MPQLVLKDFNLGGMSDSPFQGLPNSLYKVIGMDIHSVPGIMKLSQALKKESGSTLNGFCKRRVVCSNGETYFFEAGTGTIYRRTSAGAWSVAYTTVPTSGGAGCLGAFEYNGYVYWATQNYLHRITTANALTGTWAVLDANWKLFGVTDADFHPMRVVNDVLWIGDGNQICKVDGTTFTGGAFQKIKSPHRVSALGENAGSLLIGTYVSSDVNRCAIFDWDTVSNSYTSDPKVMEVGVNCFLPTTDFPVAQCGNKGNFYYYDGFRWKKYKRIPGDWSAGKTAVVYEDAAVNVNGTVLFAPSNVAGNPVTFGVYELGGYDPKYPDVMHVRHLLSSAQSTGISVGCLAAVGDKLLAAWQDASTVGADVTDTANKTAIGVVQGRFVAAERDVNKQFRVIVGYKALPSGTSISPGYYDAGAGLVAVPGSPAFKVDSARKVVTTDGAQVPKSAMISFYIEVVGSGNSTPEIDSITIDW